MVVFILVPRSSTCRIEAPNCQQNLKWDIAPRCLDDSYAMDLAIDPFFGHLDVLRTDEIDLVEHNQIRKADLAQLEQVDPLVVPIGEDPLGIDDAGDAVETQQPFVPRDPETSSRCLPDRPHRWLPGSRSRWCIGAFEEFFERPDQVVTDLAAHATVGEIDRVLFDAFHELGVDIDRAEVVDQHTDPQSVLSVENAVQKGRLAGAQEPGQEGDRDGITSRYSNRFGSRSRSEYRFGFFCHAFSHSRRGARYPLASIAPLLIRDYSSTLIPRALSISRGFSVHRATSATVFDRHPADSTASDRSPGHAGTAPVALPAAFLAWETRSSRAASRPA